MKRLTEKQVEELAKEIRKFLLDRHLWVDVKIYFNGKSFDTHDKVSGKFYYNDDKNLVVNKNDKPEDYFEYVNPDHILSMSFEGDLYDLINYNMFPKTLEDFDKIFEKYGVYYEIGNSWNLTCCYI